MKPFFTKWITSVVLFAMLLGFTPARERRSYQFELHWSRVSRCDELKSAITGWLEANGWREVEPDVYDTKRFVSGSFTIRMSWSLSRVRLEVVGAQVVGCRSSTIPQLDSEVIRMIDSFSPDIRDAVTVTVNDKKEIYRKEPNQALQTTSVTRSGFGRVSVSDRQRRGV